MTEVCGAMHSALNQKTPFQVSGGIQNLNFTVDDAISSSKWMEFTFERVSAPCGHCVFTSRNFAHAHTKCVCWFTATVDARSSAHVTRLLCFCHEPAVFTLLSLEYLTIRDLRGPNWTVKDSAVNPQ